jgi:aminoglycoside phosphotransferase (APT) family kinase protein
MGTGLRATTSPAEPLDEVLAGRHGAAAVRRVVLEPLRFGLADLLEGWPPHRRPWSLRLVRSKYKPQRKLTAYYCATYGGAEQQDRHLAVTWCSSEAAVSSAAPTATPDPVSLLVYPTDPSMPALGRLSRGEHVASLVASLTGAAADSVAPPGVRVIRYRPGQRHVLRVGGAAGSGATIVKCDRDDSGARAVPLAHDLGPVLARRCPGVGLPRPVGYSVADRAALWRECDGEPLARTVATSSRAGALVERLGRALREMHDTDVRPSAPQGGNAAGPTAARDADERLALTLRAGEHIAALLPRVGEAYRTLASEARRRLGRLPHEPPLLTHGDIKCDHALVDQDRLWLLDLDRVGLGDPAQDLGKLVADLRWWCTQDRAARLTAALRAGYGRCDAARWARAETYAVLFQLQLAARRCAVHDPRWEQQVRSRVEEAGRSLGRERRR